MSCGSSFAVQCFACCTLLCSVSVIRGTLALFTLCVVQSTATSKMSQWTACANGTGTPVLKSEKTKAPIALGVVDAAYLSAKHGHQLRRKGTQDKRANSQSASHSAVPSSVREWRSSCRTDVTCRLQRHRGYSSFTKLWSPFSILSLFLVNAALSSAWSSPLSTNNNSIRKKLGQTCIVSAFQCRERRASSVWQLNW